MIKPLGIFQVHCLAGLIQSRLNQEKLTLFVRLLLQRVLEMKMSNMMTPHLSMLFNFYVFIEISNHDILGVKKLNNKICIKYKMRLLIANLYILI